MFFVFKLVWLEGSILEWGSLSILAGELTIHIDLEVQMISKSVQEKLRYENSDDSIDQKYEKFPQFTIFLKMLHICNLIQMQ